MFWQPASRAGAQLIITFNPKDFPPASLDSSGVEAVHPDAFIHQQMDLHEGIFINAVRQHRATLKRPPKTSAEYLGRLAAQGLQLTTDRLRDSKS